ncbi:MAG TPA: hypothetical protein VKT77_12335 [Chthonomonadaceae bacterium]|nr:hypothetical protein [Chthonomonadaceae bacterium]
MGAEIGDVRLQVDNFVHTVGRSASKLWLTEFEVLAGALRDGLIMLDSATGYRWELRV